MLDDDLEKILHEKSVTGRASWVRLFDETQSALRFPMGRKRLTMSEVLNLLSDKDGEKRKRAAKALGKVLGENVRLFTLITNTLAKDKRIEDDWRHYPSPLSSRNLGNYVEDEVVEALTRSVADAFPDLSHRYYRLKAALVRQAQARLLGPQRTSSPGTADAAIRGTRRESWCWAPMGASRLKWRRLPSVSSPNAWIDAVPRAGKDSGAFSHSTVPSVHPYILMNFHGKARDVMTLAHELGHGVHQVLAGPQGTLMSDTPLTLAETASVFGEMLTFRAMLADETRSRPPAHPACRQGRRHAEHSRPPSRLSPF